MSKATYKESGVDLDVYAESMARLPRLLRRTHSPRVLSAEGGFAGLFRLDFADGLFARRYKDPVLVSGTDGVGTKLKVAQLAGVHHTVGVDLVAMCVNDVLCCGAEPLFFLDYVAMGKDDPALLESARTTAMLFMILIGALMFSEFVNITTMPADLKDWVMRLQLSPTLVMAAICAIYVVLGTAMEELSMILLTIPVFFPVVVHLGFDPIWFGVVIVCVVEIGLISPPVGMNMFVLRPLLPHVSTATIFSGVMPFMVADIIRLAILIAVPWLSLWLPGMMR